MSDATTIRRQLKIKSGVAKRVSKEHVLYRKEAEEQKRKLDKLVADHGDEYEIKNARRILEESGRMNKDSDERLGKAVQDLRDIVVQVKQLPAFAKDEDLIKAEEILEEASV